MQMTGALWLHVHSLIYIFTTFCAIHYNFRYIVLPSVCLFVHYAVSPKPLDRIRPNLMSDCTYC